MAHLSGIRTFLKDEELNGKQRKKCEPVDTLHELMKDGMYMSDVAVCTVIRNLDNPEKAAEEGLKRMEAMKKLGMENHAQLMTGIHLTFIRLLDEILHRETSMKESAAIVYIETQCGIGELVMKYVDYTDDMESKFMADVTNFYCKVAKMMKLKHVNRETITERIDAIMASSPRQT